MRLESYKGSNYKRPKIINNSADNKTSIRSKGQTKNLKKRRRLSGLYSNSNGLKMAHI